MELLSDLWARSVPVLVLAALLLLGCLYTKASCRCLSVLGWIPSQDSRLDQNGLTTTDDALVGLGIRIVLAKPHWISPRRG